MDDSALARSALIRRALKPSIGTNIGRPHSTRLRPRAHFTLVAVLPSAAIFIDDARC
jgi:hypothetical protein